MARYRSGRRSNGTPVIEVTPESVFVAPTLAPAPELVEFVKPAPSPVDPVIVTPSEQGTQWNFSQWFRETAASISASFVQMYAAAVLALHSYRLTRSNTFQDLAELALGGAAGARLHVDDSAKRWIDTYTYEDGRQLWVIPGTIDTVKSWLGYTVPGMNQVTVNSGTFGVYSGLYPHCTAYWNYLVGNAGLTANIPPGGLTIVGHSMGGTVAQYLAFRLNQLRAEANPESPVYLVNRVTSLGSPAAFDKGTVVGGLLNGYKHVRGFNPGDPIPDLTISGFVGALATGRFVTAAVGNAAPKHVANVSFPLQPGRNQRDTAERRTQYDLARGFGQRLTFWGPRVLEQIEAARTGVYDAGAHGVRNYADRLEILCRDLADCPYPLFSRLVTMSRAVDLA